jgi:hypothetical protein
MRDLFSAVDGLAVLIHDTAEWRLRISAKPLIQIVIPFPIGPDGSGTTRHDTKHGKHPLWARER